MYVHSRASDEDVSFSLRCFLQGSHALVVDPVIVSFQALLQAYTMNTAGLRYTGMAMASCARSEMILPLGAGNLQKGER